MNKIICIGIFLCSLLLQVSFGKVYCQKIAGMTLIDETCSKYMDNTEISILQWQMYEIYTMKKYGEDSPEHNAAKPDTAFFRKHYGFAYITSAKNNGKYSEGDIQFMLNSYNSYPIIGISYTQCENFCKYRTEISNNGTLEFNIPSNDDYATANKYAVNTYLPSLSPLKRKPRKLYGLADNVNEYTVEKRSYADVPTGFRCIAQYKNKE